MSHTSESFLDAFSSLEDPRIDRRKLHPMPEILLLTLCGVIAGCDGWQDLEDYGKMKLEFLRRFLPYEYGVPSDDTLRRFYRSLNPKVFQESFVGWVKSLQKDLGQVIAIDGKTSRRSKDGTLRPLHLVSAFATEARLVLAQTAVDEKTNEITAIPELLEWLDCRGAIVTIDAMGCQKDIADKIIEQGGDYVLALKKNHSALYEQVEDFFGDSDLLDACSSCETIDGEHGRIEQRTCTACSDIDWLYGKSKWRKLKSIIMIQSERKLKGTVEKERRYYITSLDSDPSHLLKAIRSHWAIESAPQVHKEGGLCHGLKLCA